MEHNSVKKDNIAAYYKNKFKLEKINENYKKKFIAEKQDEFYKASSMNTIQIENYSELREKDIGYKLIDNLARRTTKELKKRNIERKINHTDLIGCNGDYLKKYISKLFTEDMTLNNYGEWELDHIKPVSSFNLNNEDELQECFNYKNLQPLWKEDNKKKSNKIRI